ncbi:AGZA family xanthine/uracil permease-like MFS transporter [Weissella uvarum]|uniref:NCS2 family permease n=1 Tax=Weissella uvarum TaxID=1479233 RepID=UPI001961F8B2|nr:NCS2 family permease [Weissella uvarum]MBM7617778.1 AGZA family xanthine/uracil permease-like MFS transporter [Weissella uvarum]MCM0595843.1 NCS2 family permease [Weissella uvarum]
MLERIFKLKENNTSVKTEVIAGITTFVAMAYIIFLNPAVLSLTGMPSQGVFLATILTAIIGTLIMGLFANLPYALAPSIGMQAMFTYTIVFGLGFTWQQALGMVFLVGLVDVFITLTKLRSAIVKAIPDQLKHAISAGIGLFIAYIGLKNSGFLNFVIDPSNITSINNKPYTPGMAVKSIDTMLANGGITPQLTNFKAAPVVLALIGFIILVLLVVMNVPAAFLISVAATTLIGIPMGVTNTHIDALGSFGTTFKDFGSIFGQALGPQGLWSMFTTPKHILVVILTVFSMGLSGLFDAIGTFIGTGMSTGIFSKADQKEFYEGKGFKSKMDRGLVADTFATMFAGILGTSNTTTFIESSTGIKAGGRTGLTSVVVAIGFALAFIAAPLVNVIPSVATAPILVIVGISMMNEFKLIDWDDIDIAIPAFFTSAFMAFSYSISYGIAAGFIFYILIKSVKRQFKQISPVLWVVTLLFLLNFISMALG